MKLTFWFQPFRSHLLASLLILIASTSSFGQDIIVDNTGATTQSGSWYDSAGRNPYGENSKYSYSGTFTWYPALPRAGNYDVYAWWTYSSSRSTAVTYMIDLGGQQAWPKTVNQRDYSLAGRWNRLGTYTFDGIATANVSVSINSSTVNANADAVRFVFKGPDESWPVTSCPCDPVYNRAIQKYIAWGGTMLPENEGYGGRHCLAAEGHTGARYSTLKADGTEVRLSMNVDTGEMQWVDDVDVQCAVMVDTLVGGQQTVIYHHYLNMVGFESEQPCITSVLDICGSEPVSSQP